MTTDTTLDAWKRWQSYAISKIADSPLAGIHTALRDSEEVKEYPGIYIEEGSVNRIEIGGVKDGNAWQIEAITKLVTTPGEDDQEAVSKAAHDVLRNALSKVLNDCRAVDWMDNQIAITCFQILDSSPKTTEEDGYRVTTWSNVLSVCVL